MVARGVDRRRDKHRAVYALKTRIQVIFERVTSPAVSTRGAARRRAGFHFSKACLISVFCSRLCASGEPVAGLALGMRPT